MSVDAQLGWLGGAIAWLFIGALVGHLIGEARDTGGGAVFGAILGPLGWLLIFCMDERPRCPECRGKVFHKATRCCHCGAQLPKQRPPEPPPPPEPTAAPPVPPIPPGMEQVNCPQCEQPLLVPCAQMQEPFECVHCGRGFVPQPAR